MEIAGHEHVIRGRGYVHSTTDLEDVRAQDDRGRRARTSQGRRRGRDRSGHPTWSHRPRWRGRGRRRHRHHALRPERARRDRRREGAAGRDPAHAARRRPDRGDLRSVRADPRVDRHPPPHADRGDDRRGGGHLPVPAPRAERADPDPDVAHRRAARVHPDGAPAPHREHHVARRHRGRDRRHGRRVDHPDREHPPEDRCLGAPRPEANRGST